MNNLQAPVHITVGGMNPLLPKVHSIVDKIFTVYESDIFLESFPKSGNTWARFLLANLLAPEKIISFRNVDDYVFGWGKEWRTALKTAKHPRIIKSHFRAWPHYPRFAYIVRDGRDVLVSYYSFMKATKDPNLTFSEFLDLSLGGAFRDGTWHDHINQAMKVCAHLDPEKYIILQYERFVEEPMLSARQLALFCGIKFSDAQLKAAVDKCAFVNLQHIEKTFGPERLDQPYTFFRHGKPGQWQEIFSGADLKKFNSIAGDTMKKLGYI